MSLWNRWFGKSPPASATAAEVAPPPEFPYPLVAVAGQHAFAAWQRLREAWRAEGACPVMLGTRDEVERLAAVLAAPDAAPAQVLAAASGQTMATFLDGRLREHRAMFDEAERSEDELAPEDADGLFVELGEWPEASRPHELCAHLDLRSRKPKPLVYVARIPTPSSWEIPAYLRFGGWNECPAPEDQVVAHRAWNERYGAEIYSVLGDVVECWVERPPQDEDSATALAREQYLYCSDIVEQGTNTLLALAATLKQAPAWFFWWD